MNQEQKPTIDFLDFWIPIVNTGNTSVTNISMGFIQSEHEITKQDLARLDMTSIPDLPADDYYYHSFSISYKQFTHLNTAPIFVGIYMCYDVDNNIYKNRQYYEIVYKINNNKISLL